MSTIVLVYEPGPGEGPEPKYLGNPFNCQVQPNQQWATANEAWARELVLRVPQIRVVSGAPYPGWPHPPVEASTGEAAPVIQPEPKLKRVKKESK